MATVFDTPTSYKNQVAHKVNVLASAAQASDPNLTITGQLHNYPWTGDMVHSGMSVEVELMTRY
jgi:hypothetical protein